MYKIEVSGNSDSHKIVSSSLTQKVTEHEGFQKGHRGEKRYNIEAGKLTRSKRTFVQKTHEISRVLDVSHIDSQKAPWRQLAQTLQVVDLGEPINKVSDSG